MTTQILLADIGGTNARLVIAGAGQRPPAPATFKPRNLDDLNTAIAMVLRKEGDKRPRFAAFCAAGPVEDGAVTLTNRDMKLDADALAEANDFDGVLLVNDFEATAASLPVLTPADLRKMGGGEGKADAPRAVLGPGTGLGMAVLIPDGRGGFIPVASEGGHIDLAPSTEREAVLYDRLRAEFGHVSPDIVLSGPGLVRLYRAVLKADGAAPDDDAAAEIIAKRAHEKSSGAAIEAVTQFTAFLGAVAGDAALMFGAKGGVYLSGGILPQWAPHFDAKHFRQRFEAKGRLRDYLAKIPAYIVILREAPLLGLSRLAAEKLG